MKNFCLLTILLLFLFTTANSQVIDEPYDFPIKPGTPEWFELTWPERFEALQVPDDILKRLSTRALMETCLNYPRFIEFNSNSINPLVSINWIMNEFNGFGELFLRQDAFTCLFEKYVPFDLNLIITEGELGSKFIYLEILLFQDEIINSMNYEEKILLLQDSYSKYKKMLEQREKPPTRFTLYIMATLLVALDEPEITAEINNSENIKLFLVTTRITTDNDPVNEIEILVNKVLQNNGTVNINEPEKTPTTSLSQNYPNPFNPTTTIQYGIPKDEFVKLTVYDVTGREVATLVDSYQNQGSYDVTFNANSLASGIYFYKLNAGGKQFINKMLLMK